MLLKHWEESTLPNTVSVFLNAKQFAIFNKPKCGRAHHPFINFLTNSKHRHKLESVSKKRKLVQSMKINGDCLRATGVSFFLWILFNHWANQQVYLWAPTTCQGLLENQRLVRIFPWLSWEIGKMFLLDSKQVDISHGKKCSRRQRKHLHNLWPTEQETDILYLCTPEAQLKTTTST